MKKLLWLAMAVAILSLTACHGEVSRNEFAIPETFDTSKEYTLSFWAKNDTNATQLNVYKKAIADFEALYPNIHIELKSYTDYQRIYQDVITNIATNTTPNICVSYPDHIATYLTGSNVMAPLNELMAHEKYGFGGSELRYDGPTRDEMVPAFLEECIVADRYYLVPYMRSTEACYINKELVEALGYEIPDVLTWDFMFEVADAATKKDADGNYAVNGQNVMIPIIYKSTDNMMIQYLRQKAAAYSNDRGDILIFNPETRAFLLSLVSHVKNGAFSTFKISSYPGNFLNVNQCVFAIDSTAGATWMGTDAPLSDLHDTEAATFTTVVRPVPQVDPENPKMISQGPSLCIFNKEDSQEVLASWLFTQFLLTNDVQVRYAQTEGYVPVTYKAQRSEAYQDYLSHSGEDNNEHYSVKIDATKLLLANLDHTFVTPVFNGSASLRQAAGELIENVAKSTRRKQTVDDAYLTKMFEDVTSLYRLDQLSSSTGGAKKDFSGLPATATVLLISIAAVWLCMGIVLLVKKVRKKH